ncbi:MAG: phage tail protein I [Synergistaceae bacterium]|nr:phage tail protein I [Synergistaceae bacterium]
MNTLLSHNLETLTPNNLIADENISALAKAIDPQLALTANASFEAMILPRIDELPEQVLDLLAWQMHVDFYDLAYSPEIKRKAVKGSLLWHMKKGTVQAIIEALNLIDIQGTFIHWKDIPDGKPYTFSITAIVAGDFYRTRGKDRLASSIRRAVNDAKAERSYLASLDIRIEPKESMSLYPAFLWVRNYDISLGVEKKEMHELLLLFEQRIIDKLVSYGERFTEKMDSFSRDLTQKLAENERNILARVEEYESNVGARIDDCEEGTARRIQACEEETARRIANCETQTANRIQSYENRVMVRINCYERDLQAGMSQLVDEVHTLREMLLWKGAGDRD